TSPTSRPTRGTRCCPGSPIQRRGTRCSRCAPARRTGSMSCCRAKERRRSSTYRGKHMKLVRGIAAVVFAFWALLWAAPARAEETIKVGLVAEFSGPFAGYGKQIQNGIKAYMKQHGDTVAGKKIELVLKDTTGPSPEVAKRLAQDLITQDKVDFLAGFGL